MPVIEIVLFHLFVIFAVKALALLHFLAYRGPAF